MTAYSRIRRDIETREALRGRRYRHPYVTFGLLAINCSMFLIECVLSAHQFHTVWDFLWIGEAWDAAAIQLGALTPTMFAHGEYWRLLAHMFIHLGFVHIAVNMFGLMLGMSIEQVYGRVRYLVIYFASGLLGGVGGWVALLLWHAPLAAGASAALFGISLAFNMPDLWYFRRSRRPLWGALLLIIPLYVLSAFVGNPFAHLTGALVGGGLACLFLPHIGQEARKRWKRFQRKKLEGV